jgi:hypothetical protein
LPRKPTAGKGARATAKSARVGARAAATEAREAQKAALSLGTKRYLAFMETAKRHGQSRSDASKIYKYFKTALGGAPKRGDYSKYGHWIGEAKAGQKPVGAGGPGGRTGGGAETPGAGVSGGREGAREWWESPEEILALQEDDNDIYAS